MSRLSLVRLRRARRITGGRKRPRRRGSGEDGGWTSGVRAAVRGPTDGPGRQFGPGDDGGGAGGRGYVNAAAGQGDRRGRAADQTGGAVLVPRRGRPPFALPAQGVVADRAERRDRGGPGDRRVHLHQQGEQREHEGQHPPCGPSAAAARSHRAWASTGVFTATQPMPRRAPQSRALQTETDDLAEMLSPAIPDALEDLGMARPGAAESSSTARTGPGCGWKRCASRSRCWNSGWLERAPLTPMSSSRPKRRDPGGMEHRRLGHPRCGRLPALKVEGSAKEPAERSRSPWRGPDPFRRSRKPRRTPLSCRAAPRAPRRPAGPAWPAPDS